MKTPDAFAFRLVGVTFAPTYPLFVHAIADLAAAGRLPVKVSLERDRDNPHDRNAIAVTSKTYGRIGHVPRHVAARLAPAIDSGMSYSARITEAVVHPDHPDNPGIQIHVQALATQLVSAPTTQETRQP